MHQTVFLLILILLKNNAVGMGIWAIHTHLWRYSSKMFIFVVLGYNNFSASNSNDFNNHTCSKSACWMGISAKQTNFIQNGRYSSKTYILVILCYNCWSIHQTVLLFILIPCKMMLLGWGYEQNRQILFRAEDITKNVNFCRFWV